ncbi:unnamed protein product [Linum trigynum]|uniref:Uncharacterized protein n=1 Tax=Linum trigynum TaxID=586398 RepID=A0AAV2CGH3_9ROSI
MRSSKLSDLSWAELREQARCISRRCSSEELPTAQVETVTRAGDSERPPPLIEADPCADERRPEPRTVTVDAGEEHAPSEPASTLSLHSMAGLSSPGTLHFKAQVEEQLAIEETPAATTITVTMTEPQHPIRGD